MVNKINLNFNFSVNIKYKLILTMSNGIFIFRRDLRLIDNIGLIEAYKQCDNIFLVFIFDNRQIKKSENKFFSYNAFAFMIESIIELKQTIESKGGTLNILRGNLQLILKNLFKKLTNEDKNMLFVNNDYTPFSRKRDEEIKTLCKEYNIIFNSYHDIPLNSPESIKPYQIFTPYYNVAKLIEVNKPKNCNFNFKKFKDLSKNFDTLPISELNNMLKKTNLNTAKLRQIGGRSNGIILLKKTKNLNYSDDRNYPSKSTTRLSAHIKFGTISIREVYHYIYKTKKDTKPKNLELRSKTVELRSKTSESRSKTSESKTNHINSNQREPLIRQLYWRDFYIQIAYHFPHVFGHNFRTNFKWKPANPKVLEKWKTGNTGIDIIDAGMRELLATGFMHNRLRMITANALVYIFKIDWREGELHFAQHLTDYDPCNNNGGWQWAAGTGADANPYYRVFNPERQAKIWDKNNEYINKWLTS